MQAHYLAAIVFLWLSLATGQNPGKQASAPVGLALPHYQADFTPVIANGLHGISWDKGHLVSYGAGLMKEPVTVYDKTGKWIFEHHLSFENAIQVYAQDAAVTSSGTAVVAASAVTADGAAADLLVQVGKDGIRHTIRTSPFYALKVCATDEGTVWAFGREMTADRRGEPRTHYPMLREYSFEKGELRSELDRASFRVPQGIPLHGARGEFQMRCGSGKVVIVSGVTNELMEYDFSTSKLSRWPIAPLQDGFYINGAALTDSGKVYVSAFLPGQGAQTAMLRLQVNSSGTTEWTPLSIVPSGGKFFILLGSDGEELVYSRGRAAPTLFWSKASEAEVTK